MSAKESQIKMYEHSEVKVRLLKLYLERYLNILTQTPYVTDIYVCDLFCGEGLYEDGGKGSPIVILETINVIHQSSLKSGKKTGHFLIQFNDKDSSKITKLEWIINDKKLFQEGIGKLVCTKEDYQTLLPKVVNKINSFKKEKAFVFIDPYGYKDISVKNILSLLQSKKTEVLLFLPTQFMFRFEAKGTPQSLLQFINELVPEEQWPKSETGVDFIENLRDAFRKRIGNDFFVDSFIITRDKNQFFSLFFFTSHIYGFDRMLESKWEIDNEEGRGWYYEKPSLFTNQPVKPNTIKFERILNNFLKGNFRTNKQVYEFTIRNGHLISHATDILSKIQSEGSLEIISKDGKSVRNNTFYIKYKDYRDNPDKIKMKIK